jgi:hypothetical protein
MPRIVWDKPKRPSRALWAGLAVLLVLLAAYAGRGSSSVRGEIRETPRPDAFLSGGARSEIVLREINETLKRIDARLERFERALREPDAEGSAAPVERNAAEPGNGR